MCGNPVLEFIAPAKDDIEFSYRLIRNGLLPAQNELVPAWNPWPDKLLPCHLFPGDP